MTIKSLSNSARGLNLDTVGTDNDEHDILHVCIKALNENKIQMRLQ